MIFCPISFMSAKGTSTGNSSFPAPKCGQSKPHAMCVMFEAWHGFRSISCASVRRAGFEPAHPCGHQSLSLACLPFQHLRIWRSESDSNAQAHCCAASLAGRCLTIRQSLHGIGKRIRTFNCRVRADRVAVTLSRYAIPAGIEPALAP